MRKDEIMTAIEAARKAGSFTLKFIFALEAEIFMVRSFVSTFAPMSNGHRIDIDDDTMTRLRIAAIKRKWQEDTDRIVVITMCDNFDESEFITKLLPVIDGIEFVEAVPREQLQNKNEIKQGTMSPKKAIRHAQSEGQRELKIVIPNATHTDAVLFMDLFSHGYISFLRPDEELVFKEAKNNNAWSLGGRLSATIYIEKAIPVHAAEGVMNGAHVKVKTIRIVGKS